MNKYDDFIFLTRDGEKYVYTYKGKEMEFDSPQDAQQFIDGKRGERMNDGQVSSNVQE
jgi:hypothetical protein